MFGGRKCMILDAVVSTVCAVQCPMVAPKATIYNTCNIAMWIRPHTKDIFHVSEIEIM